MPTLEGMATIIGKIADGIRFIRAHPFEALAFITPLEPVQTGARQLEAMRGALTVNNETNISVSDVKEFERIIEERNKGIVEQVLSILKIPSGGF